MIPFVSIAGVQDSQNLLAIGSLPELEKLKLDADIPSLLDRTSPEAEYFGVPVAFPYQGVYCVDSELLVTFSH